MAAQAPKTVLQRSVNAAELKKLTGIDSYTRNDHSRESINVEIPRSYVGRYIDLVGKLIGPESESAEVKVTRLNKGTDMLRT